MICAIKRFGHVKCTDIDSRAILSFCHLSNGINRIPTAQILLEAIPVIRDLEEFRKSV